MGCCRVGQVCRIAETVVPCGDDIGVGRGLPAAEGGRFVGGIVGLSVVSGTLPIKRSLFPILLIEFRNPVVFISA